MELKELKREIDGLADVNKSLSRFRKAWVKGVDKKARKEVKTHLSSYRQILEQLKYAQFTHEKLSSLAQYLIELKLASLNGDNYKPRVLVKKFVKDDFLNLRLMVDETNQFEFNLNSLKQIYEQVNQILGQKLPLEQRVALMSGPHREALNNLLLTSKKQKKLLKILGREFILLTRELKRKKRL